MVKIDILIAAGGTFGHIRPALALKQEFFQQNNFEVKLYCSTKDKRFQVLKQEKNISFLKIKGLPRRLQPFKHLYFSILLLYQLKKVFICYLFKRPKVVIGCGGFVSFPFLLWAKLLKIPYFLLEQNSVMGFVNRLFSNKAQCVFLSIPLMNQKKIFENRVVVGNPINMEIYERQLAFEMLHLEKKFKLDQPILGVMGGSSGALGLNQWLIDNSQFLIENRIQCLLICGSNNYVQFRQYEQENLMIVPFIDQMQAFYSVCDYFISRAGASSIAELIFYAKPVFFVPYPYATANHQRQNAEFAQQYLPSFLKEEKDLPFTPLKSIIQQLQTLQKRPDFQKIKIRPEQQIVSIVRDFLC